jgi:DNA-binding IclR family transcriptional regulator
MQVLNKALDLLELFLESAKTEYGLSEISKASHMNVSTCHRLIGIFVKRRYLQQKGNRGRYALGPKLIEYALRLEEDLDIRLLRDAAMQHLQQLNRATNEAINLAVLDGHDAICIVHLPSAEEFALRISTPVGTRNPLYCTGLGKVLLAYQDERSIKSYIDSSSLTPYTRNTIVDATVLREELAAIRKIGIAEDREEAEIGMCCIAGPVRDAEGRVVAAVSVTVPTVRIQEAKPKELKRQLKKCLVGVSETVAATAKLK